MITQDDLKKILNDLNGKVDGIEFEFSEKYGILARSNGAIYVLKGLSKISFGERVSISISMSPNTTCTYSVGSDGNLNFRILNSLGIPTDHFVFKKLNTYPRVYHHGEVNVVKLNTGEFYIRLLELIMIVNDNVLKVDQYGIYDDCFVVPDIIKEIGNTKDHNMGDHFMNYCRGEYLVNDNGTKIFKVIEDGPHILMKVDASEEGIISGFETDSKDILFINDVVDHKNGDKLLTRYCVIPFDYRQEISIDSL